MKNIRNKIRYLYYYLGTKLPEYDAKNTEALNQSKSELVMRIFDMLRSFL